MVRLWGVSRRGQNGGPRIGPHRSCNPRLVFHPSRHSVKESPKCRERPALHRGRERVARQSGWEGSDDQDGHFGGHGEVMIVAARSRKRFLARDGLIVAERRSGSCLDCCARGRASGSRGFVDGFLTTIAVHVHFEDRSVAHDTIDGGERHGWVGRSRSKIGTPASGGKPYSGSN
jgi:hypothetical protein